MNESLGNCRNATQLFIKRVLSNKSDLLDIGSIINLFLNAILAVTATLGNGMIIVAILRSQNLQTPSYLLITSLAFTDLLVGLVFHPLHMVAFTFFLQGHKTGLCAIAPLYVFLVVFFGAASAMTVTCISIDRYLALTLRHRYTIFVTKKRVRFLIAAVWVLAFVGAFLNNVEKYHNAVFAILILAYLVLLSIISVFYIKSFRALHLYTVQVHAQQPNPLAGNFDVVRYKKTLKTMLVVLACLLLCSVPSVCAFLMWKKLYNQKEEFIVYFTSITLMCLHSSINPLIYLMRFTDIRNACREIWTFTVNRCVN